ncbi:uncharacterized protein DMENIID0001_076570 [Sergentomyia squamirostris]
MSQNLESPGFAEARMDISSETTSQSQESPGITSPDDDIDSYPPKSVSNCPNLIDQENPPQGLDNRIPDKMQSKSGLLTLTSSHPLMSPIATDSDSDNGHKSKSSSRFAYPDVVPDKENITKKRVKVSPSVSRPANTSLSTKFDELDIVDNPGGRSRKMPTALRDLSPERMASSGSEQDLSQYQASVTPTFQAVALVSRPTTTSSHRLMKKIPVSSDLLSDASSIESLSNRSFDDDFEPNVISGSPASSLFDNNIFHEDQDEMLGEESELGAALAASESSGEKQKVILPDGRTREIDMKVIEPFKRVLSHGGYLKTAGHNAIVIFSACYLPDRSRKDYHYVMDSLFLYVVKTLEQFVTDDYVMIYLHGGSCRSNVPPFHWLRKCYQLLDRRLRKSLKTLYMVHPTFWLKSIVLMSRPFISSKFWRKLIYVNNLDELYTMVPMMERAAVPEKVKNYNSKCV